MKKKYLPVILILVCTVSFVHSQGNMLLRPYVKVGYLLSGPSANDLGYVIVGGGDPNQYLDVNRVNYGLGAQFVFGSTLFPIEPFQSGLGFDVGFQKIFSSKYDLKNEGSLGASGVIYEDNHIDRENEASLLCLLELRHRSTPLMLQAGIGLHMVFWQWEYNYSSNNSTSYDSESGTGTSLGLMAAGGWNIPITNRMKLPIMVRIDGIARYGMETILSACVGFPFTL